jgi:hypothetical protein
MRAAAARDRRHIQVTQAKTKRTVLPFIGLPFPPYPVKKTIENQKKTSSRSRIPFYRSNAAPHQKPNANEKKNTQRSKQQTETQYKRKERRGN